MSAPQGPKEVSQTAEAGGTHGFYLRPRTRIGILVACFVLMIAASVYAVLQPLNPDPANAGLAAGIWYPRETNPYARLPFVKCANSYACRLNSVAVNGGGNAPEVWAVGNVGLVLHRPAGSAKWEQLVITARAEAMPAPAPTPTPRPSPTPAGQRTGSPRPTPAPALTPTPTSTATPTPVPPRVVVVPDLVGLSRDAAEKAALAVQLTLKVEYARGAASSQNQQGRPPDLRVVAQSPLPGSRVAPGTVITVTLGQPPPKTSLLLDSLVPSVYAAPPEKRPSPVPQQTAPPSNVPAGRRLQTQSAGSAPSDTPVPLDDDLIFAGCKGGGCDALGRSGRIYNMDGISEWTFTQASFLDSRSAPMKAFVPLNVLDREHLIGGSGNAAYRCSLTSPVPSARFECAPDNTGVFASADHLVKMHLANGQETDFYQFDVTNTGTTRLLLGSSGEVRRLPDDGRVSSAERVPSGTAANLRSYSFGSSDAATQGFIVGDQGAVLASTDGGTTWRHETQGPEGSMPNHRLPAVWYWILSFLLIVTCAVVVATPPPPPPTEFSVADWTVTDAPLKPGDLDSLDFTPMALGLSRFIRNPKTQPPVTIAIEGEWGEGKSSVMALLRGDLEKSRFRPVWFNAWHHQSEEQLLAALLEHIKGQALPPWWHIDNWIFRARLLHIRFRQKWPFMVLLTLALCSAVAYELSRHGLRLEDFTKFAKDFLQLVKYLLPWSSQKDLPDDLGHFGLVATVLAMFAAIFKKARAFGIDSSKLTDNLRSAATIKDVKPEPGIRARFAREFGDLCAAWSWGGRRVIIFIDDLDRCRPESVVTVLESINFLTTAGDCMIVLGMAQKQVTHCVGLGFKDIAQAEAAYAGGGNTEQEKAVARFNYGSFYIKKLVNIVAPLPKTSPEQRRSVLELRAAESRRKEEADKASGAAEWRTSFWGALAEAGRVTSKVVPVFALALAVLVSVIAGYRQGSIQRPLEGPAKASSGTVGAAPVSSSGPAVRVPGAEAKALEYTRPTSERASLQDSRGAVQGGWMSYAVDAMFLLVLFGILAYQLSARTNLDAQNSPEFENSLKLWGQYIVGVCDTPREIKRALNDLRYQAMTRRMNGPSITRGERLLRVLRQFVTGRAEPQQVARHVDEAALPPLKAAALADLNDDELQSFLDPDKTQLQGSENLKRLTQLKIEHIKTFGRWMEEVKHAPEQVAANVAPSSPVQTVQ